MSLRSRLADARARQGEGNLALPASGDVILTPGSARAISRALVGARGVVLGRRAYAALGTSASRRAMLPAGAARELMEAAAVAGEPVVQLGGPDERPERVIYAPDLISRSPRSMQALGAHTNRQEVRPAEATSSYDRHHFEAFFAAQIDPWKYTTPYEQTKYEQTLAMLPPGNVARALELACAEGLFTVQLASRVGHLLAADISEVALERATKRCADMKHIRFARLDLTRDPLPGRFELIVCSEVLYYVGGQDALQAVARKLADALEPGGYLLMAHANLVVDEPDRTGFDWDVPFGAQVIGETFMRVPTLGLVKEFRTPLYRIHLFQREPLVSLSIQRKDPEVIEMMQPAPLSSEIAAHVLWRGGRPRRSGADQAVVTHRLPILMYHRVAPDGSPALARYRVTPEAFEAQLRYLCEAGFHSVRLDDWRAAMEVRRPLPGRAIHITFDDGYRDFLTNAWPLLEHYGFSATVFLVADRIGQSSSWDRGYGAEFPLLGWSEIHQLAGEGVEFGSHSASHPFLTALALEDLVREGAHSRALLECGLGVPVRAFAYPYGDVDQTVQHLVGACGYVFGLSCESRLSSFHDSLLALPRLEIAGSDSLAEFVARLGA